MSPRSLSSLRLRQAREAAGLNQREAAKAAGISRGTIQNAEAGLSSPRAEALMRIAEVYGVTVDSFFEDHGPTAAASSALRAALPHRGDRVTAATGTTPPGAA